MNIAQKYGFYFHHAKPEGYVQMCLWLDKSTPNKIPNYANHYIGVAGLVVNDENEILLIQENKSV